MVKKVLFVLLLIVAAVIALGALYMIVLFISNTFINSGRLYTKDSKYCRWFLYSSSVITLWFARIHIEKNFTKEDIPEGRFLFVGNHRSKFDPIIAWTLLMKSKLAFISKEENFHIPFYGRIIRKCCFMPIDRENPRNAIKTIEHAAELAKAGTVSIGVYPEGTRSKTYKLLPFHNGVFKIAQKSNVPIVVMTMQGTENIHRNFPLRGTDVQVHLLGVIQPEEFVGRPSKEIGDRVRDMMLADLGE